MDLQGRFYKATAIVAALNREEKERVQKVCVNIRRLQQAILEQGAAYLEHCTQVCQGLCCRNIRADEMVSLYDFIFLLVLAPEMQEPVGRQARRPAGPYTSDCLFLHQAKGPCVFPVDAKPERCISSFCFDTPSISGLLGRLRRSFTHLVLLCWLFRLRCLLSGS